MTTPDPTGPIDPQEYRRVLGHLPTGVVGVTSLAPDGSPVGMAIGSFTSVSLDPPLVAFLPARTSQTYPVIRRSGRFCVNVLTADQEHVCRAFATSGGDKFAEVSWAPSRSGSPILDGALAWVDCDVETVYEAGDHDIVIGRVRSLGLADDALPLVFFQGGYGRLAPLSVGAGSEPDLVDQLRTVDVARPHMERVAIATGVECVATVVAGGDMVIAASTGVPQSDRAPTRVGQRVPLVPPLGAALVAWSESATDAWLGRSGRDAVGGDRECHRAAVARVRERGWSLGLASAQYRAFESALAGTLVGSFTPRQRRLVQNTIDQLGGEYEPELLEADRSYPVRNVNVPVFGPGGGVVLLLSAFRLPPTSSVGQIELYRDTLMAGAEAVSEELRP